jgi:glycosyltransferase involved in cell wall biosynthesis
LDVTVYLPCYNVAGFLPRVIGALQRQTAPAREIIAVDDGSTDGSAEVAARLGVRVVRHGQNRGLGAARNTAVRSAQTPYVASVDGDVVAHPDWLERMMGVASEGPWTGMGGDLRETQLGSWADRWRALHMRQSWGERRIEDPAFLFGANTLFRREAIIAVGGYNEVHRTNGEDLDLCRRLKAAGHRLLYDPVAVCDHLRTDTLRSLSRTFWRWHHPGGRPATWRGLGESFRYNARHLGVIFKRDMRAARPWAAALDFWLACDWTWFELRAVLRRA